MTAIYHVYISMSVHGLIFFFLLVYQYISADVIQLHIEVQHRNSERNSESKLNGEENEDQDIKFKINGNLDQG